MHRRALLAALPTTLAGCSLLPSGPDADRYPATPPNVFVAFDWDADASALAVELTRGNRVTESNTDSLVVRSEFDDREPVETVWVGDGGADGTDEGSDAAASFPLGPGDSVRHDLPEPAETRLIWIGDDGGSPSSRVVDRWAPDDAGSDR